MFPSVAVWIIFLSKFLGLNQIDCPQTFRFYFDIDFVLTGLLGFTFEDEKQHSQL